MISDQDKQLIAQTLPLLKEQGTQITQYFYKNMFAHHPELKNLFNMTNQAKGDQPQALANAVYAYAANIDNPQALEPVMSRIAHKHASLGIKATEYTIVGKYLLNAIATVLGDKATKEILRAWDEAYWLLACQLVALEAVLYHQSQSKTGSIWLNVTVDQLEQESCDTVSIYLKSTNGQPLPQFKAGQYISVMMDIESVKLRQFRQYSLSDSQTKDYWRITVKKQSSRHQDHLDGLISSKLHQLKPNDQLTVSHGYGDFTLDNQHQHPVVFISKGVGITPMMSMLKTLEAERSKRKIVFLHETKSPEQQIFQRDLDSIGSHLHDVRMAYFYPQGAQAFKDEHVSIFNTDMDLESVKSQILIQDAHFYLCGALDFMRVQRNKLIEFGVDVERIHYEVFGPDLLLGLS